VYENFSDEQKEAIRAVNATVSFCEDAHGGDCRCSERAGAFCNLMNILCRVSHRTDQVIALFKDVQDESGEKASILGLPDLCNCQCQEGIDYKIRFGTMLTKLERQLMSFPPNIRRELLVWYIDKLTGGYVPFSAVAANDGRREPRFIGEYCSDELLRCHADYGELMYEAAPSKGCKCHGS